MYSSPVCVQREREAHTGAQERGRLEEELRGQQRLIDALSTETMALREEVTLLQVKPADPVTRCQAPTLQLTASSSKHSTPLQTRLQQQSADMEQKLDTVVLVMGELGLLEAGGEPRQGSGPAAGGVSLSLSSTL